MPENSDVEFDLDDVDPADLNPAPTPSDDEILAADELDTWPADPDVEGTAGLEED